MVTFSHTFTDVPCKDEAKDPKAGIQRKYIKIKRNHLDKKHSKFIENVHVKAHDLSQSREDFGEQLFQRFIHSYQQITAYCVTNHDLCCRDKTSW